MYRSIKYYSDLRQLNGYIYHNGKFEKPKGWEFADKYEDKHTGFYAEAYKNWNDEVFIIIRGTDMWSRDIITDAQIDAAYMPNQVKSAYKFYDKLAKKYNKIGTSGYSLGASIASILGNELDIETVNFAPLAVGKFIKPKHTEKIINFGHCKDPAYRKNFDYHLGKVYVLSNDNNINDYYNYDTKVENFETDKHYLENMGDLNNAYAISKNSAFNTAKFSLYANYNKFDESILMPSNRIFLGNEKMKGMDEETLKQFVNQYYDDDYKFPSKEELDRRVRFGELIYVESYTRADETKVSGYYRRYPD